MKVSMSKLTSRAGLEISKTDCFSLVEMPLEYVAGSKNSSLAASLRGFQLTDTLPWKSFCSSNPFSNN